MNATTADAARKIWKESAPITGTLAEAYLEWRGLAPLSPPPQCLRFAAKLKHPNEQYFPALIVQATMPETGDPIGGVQRVFLAWTGKGKAQVSPKEQKMSLGPCKGAVARLAEPIDGEPLMIGEGVETVLTAMQATGLPGWATLGTSGLRKLDPPSNVTEVILLAENDGGWNKKALDAAIPTLIERGIRVAVATPPDGVKDFNDLVNGKSGHAPAAGLAMVKAAIEGAQGVREEKAAADAPDASTHWADAERDIVSKLALGDGAAFLARAKSDPGFPFEPEAIGALNKFARGRPADWQRLRARLKTDPKIHLSALEATMKAEAVNNDDGGAGDGMAGRPVRYDEIEPWHEPVDGADLLTELSGAIGAYVIMDAHQRDAVALWTVFAHAHDLRDYAPLLVVTAPTKRCGKTRLQETLAPLVPKPQPTSGITAALLPRLVEKHRPTLLIDEYDAQTAGDPEMAESLRGQLNSSFNKASAVVLKLVPVPGGGWEERQFSTWAPTCVAGIGMVPDTVKDRSVVIRLSRKPRDTKVRRLRGRDGGDLVALARRVARFVNDNEYAIRNAEPASPDALNDRQADAWDPLLAIADLAGGSWPEQARNAAQALCGVEDKEDAERDNKVVLLMDIRGIFARLCAKEGAGRPDDGPRLLTKRLLDELHRLEERPWGAWGKARKPLTDMGLASLLRPYQIRSNTVRGEDALGNPERGKGYYLRSFEDAFSRYLPIFKPPGRDGVTSPENAGENEVFEGVTNASLSRVENPRNANKSAACHNVTGWEPENRGPTGDEAAVDAAEDRPIDWGQI